MAIRYLIRETALGTEASAAVFSSWYNWQVSQHSGLVLAGKNTKGLPIQKLVCGELSKNMTAVAESIPFAWGPLYPLKLKNKTKQKSNPKTLNSWLALLGVGLFLMQNPQLAAEILGTDSLVGLTETTATVWKMLLLLHERICKKPRHGWNFKSLVTPSALAWNSNNGCSLFLSEVTANKINQWVYAKWVNINSLGFCLFFFFFIKTETTRTFQTIARHQWKSQE